MTQAIVAAPTTPTFNREEILIHEILFTSSAGGNLAFL
jgi:hypothetical protein